MTNFSGENLNAACGGPLGGGMDSRRNEVAEVCPKYLAEAASNAVPVGYKQTEVGVIPEDWQVTTVGKVVSITTGNKNTQDKVVDGLYPFFVRSQQVERINTYSFDGEGVLTAGDGVGTGKIFHHINGKFDFHQRVYLMYNFGDELDGYYFYIYFSNNFYDRIMSMTAKSSVDSVRREMIADMLMVMPPKAEQTAIANALSDVDSLISELEKLIAKKQAIKTATMQQLLTGRTRLPQFALREDGTPKGTKPSELGEIPEDWEVHALGSLCGYQNGKAQEQYFNSNDGYKVISIGNYSESGRYIETGSYIDKQFKNEIGRFVLSRDDLTMILNDKTAVGTIIGRVLLIEADDTYVMNQRTMRLTPKDGVKSKYLHFLINSDLVHKRIVGMAKPGTQIYVNTDDVLEFNLPVPDSQDEQTAIATILSDMDEEIQSLEQRLGKTRQIKQGMMQELLTGKTRLIQGSEAR